MCQIKSHVANVFALPSTSTLKGCSARSIYCCLFGNFAKNKKQKNKDLDENNRYATGKQEAEIFCGGTQRRVLKPFIRI